MNKKIGNYTVKSDGRFRPLLSFYDLSEIKQKKILKEFLGSISDNKDEVKRYAEECKFFKYKNSLFSLDDFIHVEKNSIFYGIMDGTMGFTFFSGIGIEFSDDFQRVKVFYFYG